MPELCDRQELFGAKSLTRREARSTRQATLVRLSHVGMTLRHLDREEKRLVAAFHAEGRTVAELCMLARALDVLRERRRILLDVPLPGVKRVRSPKVWDLAPPAVCDAELLPVLATGGNGG